LHFSSLTRFSKMATFETSGERAEAPRAPENTGAQNIVQEQVNQYKQESQTSANRPLGERDVQSLDFSSDIYGSNNRVCTPSNPHGRDSSTAGSLTQDTRKAEAPLSNGGAAPGASETPSNLERVAGAVTGAQSTLPTTEVAKGIAGVKSAAAGGARALSPVLDYGAASIHAVKGDLPAATNIIKKSAFQGYGATVGAAGCSVVPHPVVQFAKPACAAVGAYVAGQVYDLTRPKW
jgi:hypothetical protein